MVNRSAKIALWSVLVVGIIGAVLFLNIVLAAHTITTSGGAAGFSINESVSAAINISVSNTDAGQAANITQVNVTLPSTASCVFLNGSNATNSGALVFINTTTVLSWSNTSGYVVNGSETKYFWFNMTCAVSGDYNITVTTVNVTSSYSSNLTLEVNDTTSPTIDFVSPTERSGGFGIAGIPINISSSDADSGIISSVSIRLYNSSSVLVNTTGDTTAPYFVNFTGLTDGGTYYVNATVNDSAGNENSSSTRTFIYTTSSSVFNGTVYDTNGTALAGAVVNVSIYSLGEGGLTLVGFVNASSAVTTGLFSMNLPSYSSWMYKPVVTHTHANGYVDYVGQSLPSFPFIEINTSRNINFFLREAGTINITALNSTGSLISFGYVLKDTKLGYEVSMSTGAGTSGDLVYVPRNRNYSIMIWPANGDEINHFVPVSYSWNNFSSPADLSNYNATTKTLSKQFNITETYARISGYLYNSTGGKINTTLGWNVTEFTIVPFILEPSGMVSMDRGILPFNASSNVGSSDIYNLSTGFYNISLPYAAGETVSYLLYGAIKNGSGIYLGGYRNITISGAASLDFSMYTLLGSPTIINMSKFASSDRYIVNTSRLNFTLINSSSLAILSNVTAHVEFTVDYTNYNATEITFTQELSNSGGDSIFSFPLLNVTGVKEINIYTTGFAPKRASKSISNLRSNQTNISMGAFSPGDRQGSLEESEITISFYKSNSTCDVPNPPAGCSLMSSSSLEDFNPLSVIMGGGAISFRIGTSTVSVHYVNVDLLASGPPSGVFDENQTEATSGDFEAAMKFGSDGPTIYDYVLIAMPYTPGSSSQTGLNESADVNVSIPAFYGEDSNGDIDWSTPIWSVSVNGTAGANLAGNYSHYSTYSSEWGVLMGNNTCNATTTGTASIDTNYPCHIQTASNLIWLRIPHFSGTEPTATGSVITATPATASASDDSSSGSGAPTYTASQAKLEKGYELTLQEDYKVKFEIDGDEHILDIDSVSGGKVTVSISSETQTKTLGKGEVWKVELTGDNVYDFSIQVMDVTTATAKLLMKTISEEFEEEAVATGGNQTRGTGEAKETGEVGEEAGGISWWVWAIVIIIVVIVAVFVISRKKRR